MINGLSKTYSVTGWRVGYAVAPAALTANIRKVHDFLTVGAPAPLQAAGAAAVRLPDSYYFGLRAAYQERRDFLVGALGDAGFEPFKPAGAYYAMADISPLGWRNDLDFSRYMVDRLGIAVVPGSSFYRPSGSPCRYVRFAFPKRMETLQRVVPRLAEAWNPVPAS